MVKILLTSDLHIGMKGGSTPVSDSIRIITLKKIISLARDHDMLMIAGDLFDSPEISSETADIVASEFGKISGEGVRIIFTPGEGEMKDDSHIPSFIHGLNITHIFNDPTYSIPYQFTIDGQKIFVYGLPASDRAVLSSIKRYRGKGFHIGLFHVDLNLEEDSSIQGTRILHKNDMKSMNLDFYALGHNHQFRMYKYLDQIIAAYPGSPEATAFTEGGDRFVISIMVDNNEIIQIRRISVNTVRLRELVINCGEISGSDDIARALEAGKSGKDMLKLILKGVRKFRIDNEAIGKYKNEFVNLLIDDQSIPVIDLLIEEFGNDGTLRGEFFNFIRERVEKNEWPAHIDITMLSDILNRITRDEVYRPEDWLCR
jgi:DNA repair exonuclease SbcCD nuclease subunit